MKKYLPVLIATAITVGAYIIGLFYPNIKTDYITILFLGITFLVYIFSIQIKADYFSGLGNIAGKFSFNASKKNNPLGFWTLIILETIGVLILVLVLLYTLVFGA